MTRRFEQVTANFHTGRTRREFFQGREFLVVPMSLIAPGVLNGSKGPLLYPPDEIGKDPTVWNHTPMVVYHPTDGGMPISARDPEVLERQGIGYVFRAGVNNDGKLIAEGWFDVEKTRAVDKRILENIRMGRPGELSTGLFTDNEAKRGVYNSQEFHYIARNYRADHLAILPDKVGACSVKDGCGVLVNSHLLHNDSFEEAEHPRAADGKFSDSGSASVPKQTTGQIAKRVAKGGLGAVAGGLIGKTVGVTGGVLYGASKVSKGKPFDVKAIKTAGDVGKVAGAAIGAYLGGKKPRSKEAKPQVPIKSGTSPKNTRTEQVVGDTATGVIGGGVLGAAAGWHKLGTAVQKFGDVTKKLPRIGPLIAGGAAIGGALGLARGALTKPRNKPKRFNPSWSTGLGSQVGALGGAAIGAYTTKSLEGMATGGQLGRLGGAAIGSTLDPDAWKGPYNNQHLIDNYVWKSGRRSENVVDVRGMSQPEADTTAFLAGTHSSSAGLKKPTKPKIGKSVNLGPKTPSTTNAFDEGKHKRASDGKFGSGGGVGGKLKSAGKTAVKVGAAGAGAGLGARLMGRKVGAPIGRAIGSRFGMGAVGDIAGGAVGAVAGGIIGGIGGYRGAKKVTGEAKSKPKPKKSLKRRALGHAIAGTAVGAARAAGNFVR